MGLRLIQVALPLWILSYALVLDRLARFLATSRIIPGRLWDLLGPAAVLLLLVLTALLFDRHQGHLARMAAQRDAFSAVVPDRSPVIVEGDLVKLLGLARVGAPNYDVYLPWSIDSPDGLGRIPEDLRQTAETGRPIDLATSSWRSSDGPSRELIELVDRLEAQPVPVDHPKIRIWIFSPDQAHL
ncbi:hypothetical protein BH23PLA1_BH23PLA1_20990 [soil metagenome]